MGRGRETEGDKGVVHGRNQEEKGVEREKNKRLK
jgi:hypothetical protein